MKMNAFRSLQQLMNANRRRSANANRRKLRSRLSAQGFEPLESRQLLAADLGLDPYLMPSGLEWAASAGDSRTALVAQKQLATFGVSGMPSSAPEAPLVEANLVSNVIYVNDDATGANDGTSWEDAFNDLQDGLLAAAISFGSDEIWVAEGVYTPSRLGIRSVSFNLPDGVSVLGGFAASPEEPSRRDSKQYPTVLSGDIGFPGLPFDNSFSVVTMAGGTAALSGVTIEGGNANGFQTATRAGGGIRIGSGSTLAVADVVIVNNFAANVGGGVFAIGNSQISISASSIANNSSNVGGGAWFENSIVDVHASSFSNNLAQSTGGGVYGIRAPLTFIDTDILSNSAVNQTGGGMFVSNGSLIFDGGQVVGNRAGNNGGGLYPFNTITAIKDTVFRENSSGFFGGGLQVRGGSATVEGSQFYGNTATLRGGGINVDRPDTSVTVSNVIVENNTARSGGGIANTDSSMSLSNSVVSNNAAKFGGGIIHQFSTLTMTNVAVTNNTAEENAGGLLNFGGSAFIDSSEFDGNKALGLNTENFPFLVGRGGGIENVGLDGGSLIEIRNSVFHRNFAANQGGAIDNNGFTSRLVIADSRVSGNETGGNGGGLFNGGTALIERVHFASNVAQRFGGAIFIAFGQVEVNDSRLTGNKAEMALGSAVYVGLGGELLLDDLTVFSKNGIPIYYES